MKSIVVVVNDISRAQEHEWFVEMFDRSKFNITFVLINSGNSVMSQFLEKHKIPVRHLSYGSKLDLPKLIFQLYKFFRKHKFDIVHTHLFDSSISGLTAAYLARIPVRIMTRHYSDYHHQYFPSTVKYDKYMNSIATRIVAISKNVENILINRENVDPQKVVMIHHGLNMNEYQPGSISPDRVELIRRKYQLNNSGPVIGVISRFTELKGLHFVIPAFKKFLKAHKDAVLVMANANGDYKAELDKLISEVPEKNIRKIEFENDIVALYKVFDCFIHVPISSTVEAFGQTYIEALASKVPSIFTLSGIAPEFIENKRNAFVVDFCNSDQVFESMQYIATHKNELNEMLETGFNDVQNEFNIERKKLEQLYLNEI